ncbi:MAG: family 43 glycosylhydrolase [Bacteroidaceae bacterium]|nr:family 43 glycosylhydrolase [Bacteroidaceae bacterium]
MKTRTLLFAAALPLLAVSCMNAGQKTTTETQAVKDNNKIVSVPRGEQAPPANPGQRNFGGMMTMGGNANRQRAPRPQGQGQTAQRPPMQMPAMQRPAQQVRTVSLKELSMSDPFIYPDPETKTYWLTGTGGALYKSTDLEMWTGPYNVIDISGTWMQGQFVAAAEIHKFGDKFYYAGTWNNHGVCIEQVPRRYNVPLNQTQLLVSDKVDGPYLPLVKDSLFCLGPTDWDIIDGTLYEENDTVYMVFVHEWTQLIDGTMAYMPLSKDLTHRIAEPTTIFRASEAAWSKEMNSIGEATFGMKMPGWVTDGPQMFRTETGRLGMLWSSWGENRYANGIAWSESGSIKGPWIQEEVSFKGDNSGHGMLFKSFEGQLLYSVHHDGGTGRKPEIWTVDASGDNLILGKRIH